MPKFRLTVFSISNEASGLQFDFHDTVQSLPTALEIAVEKFEHRYLATDQGDRGLAIEDVSDPDRLVVIPFAYLRSALTYPAFVGS